MDIVKLLRTSGNKLLETEAEDLVMWQKLKHNKEDLELFLNHNVAEIKFLKSDGSESEVFGTSNVALIKVFSAKKDKDKIKAKYLNSSGMRSKKSNSVEIWDLIENKQKTMILKSWQIENFITISEKNILVLDQVLHDILKK